MTLRVNRLAVLAKLETTYGTDAVPTGAANAILVSSPKLTPMEADRVERDVVRPHFGNAESIPTGVRVKLDMEVELAGSGKKGTAPAWGCLLEACGFGKTVVADASVKYALSSDQHASISLHCNYDGVHHVLLGARGTVSLDLQNKALPKFKFSFTGIYRPVTDKKTPSVAHGLFVTPVPFDAPNVGALTLHGFAPAVQSVSIDLANEVTHRSLPGSSESVLITHRKPSGQIAMEAVAVKDKDWWTGAAAAA
ncbi:hypothetical protein QR66_14020, partial [Chromobacterium piscinae]